MSFTTKRKVGAFSYKDKRAQYTAVKAYLTIMRTLSFAKKDCAKNE